MKVEFFDSIVHLLGVSVHDDESVIDELMNYYNLDKYIPFITPFSKELNKNLLEKDSLQGKKDIIKHYLYDLHDLNGTYNAFYSELLFSADPNGTHVNKKDLTQIEKYINTSWDIFDGLINEIQKNCGKYGLDFIELSYEQNFSLDNIDCGAALMYEDLKMDKKFNLTELESEENSPLFSIDITASITDRRSEISKILFLVKLMEGEGSVLNEWYFNHESFGKLDRIQQSEKLRVLKTLHGDEMPSINFLKFLDKEGNMWNNLMNYCAEIKNDYVKVHSNTKSIKTLVASLKKYDSCGIFEFDGLSYYSFSASGNMVIKKHTYYKNLLSKLQYIVNGGEKPFIMIEEEELLNKYHNEPSKSNDAKQKNVEAVQPLQPATKALEAVTPPMNMDKGFKLSGSNNDKHLNELHRSLSDIGCINCNLTDFKPIFQGKEILVNKKVRWLGSAFELRKFIHEINKKRIDKSIVNKEIAYWKIALYCFYGTNGNGEKFDEFNIPKSNANKNNRSRGIILACEHLFASMNKQFPKVN